MIDIRELLQYQRTPGEKFRDSLVTGMLYTILLAIFIAGAVWWVQLAVSNIHVNVGPPVPTEIQDQTHG